MTQNQAQNEILSQEISVSDVFERFGNELSDLSENLGLVEDALLNVTGRVDELSTDEVLALQRLDQMQQALVCLNQFMSALSKEVDPSSSVSIEHAIQHIHLKKIADRLRGTDNISADALRNGDMSLF